MEIDMSKKQKQGAAVPGFQELPYDKRRSVIDTPPLCRFCLDQGVLESGGWRCSREGCPANVTPVPRDVFEY